MHIYTRYITVGHVNKVNYSSINKTEDIFPDRPKLKHHTARCCCSDRHDNAVRVAAGQPSICNSGVEDYFGDGLKNVTENYGICMLGV